MEAINGIQVTQVLNAYTVTYDKPATLGMKNRGCYGLSFAIDGKIVYRHNGKKYVSDADHAMILPMNASYILECCKPGRFTLVNFLCTEEFAPKEFISIEIREPERFFKEHRALEQLNIRHKPQNRLEFLSIFYKILSRLADSPAENGPPVLRAALRYLEENLQDPGLGNLQIASAVGISEIYLRKLFNTVLEVSPRQYIRQMRIEQAKQLLQSDMVSITETAERCGFGSVYHFCRAFKQLAGCTPTEYKNRFRQMCL